MARPHEGGPRWTVEWGFDWLAWYVNHGAFFKMLESIGSFSVLAAVMGSLMNRSITMRTGQGHVQRYLRPLLERIQAGEIDPRFIITHPMRLEDAPRRTGCSREAVEQAVGKTSARLRKIRADGT
jgi:threonine dehydrogenase-like Zn-dependent dehydrogenase